MVSNLRLHSALTTVMCDVLVFNKNIANSDLSLKNLTLYWKDRFPSTSKKSLGRGVLVAVDSHIPSFELSTSVNDVECDEELYIFPLSDRLKLIRGFVMLSKGRRDIPTSKYLCQDMNVAGFLGPWVDNAWDPSQFV